MRVRTWFLSILAFLLFSSLASAYSINHYSAEYDLGDKASVVIQVNLDSPDFYTIRLPRDAQEITVSTNYTLLALEDYTLLETTAEIKSIELSYTTGSLVEKGSDYFFILDTTRIKSGTKSILLKLPEDAKLKYSLDSEKSAVLPKTDNVITDGRRIIIRWTDSDFTTSEAILVIYELPLNKAWLAVSMSVLAIILLLGVGYYFLMYVAKQNEKRIAALHHEQESLNSVTPEKLSSLELTRNLFEEEKLIVETLFSEKTHELWQKQLEQKTGLNKVRLSRKLRHLEAKGLIEKIPYGNTNKIRLKR